MTAGRTFLLDTNICIYVQRRRPSSVLERFAKIRPGEAVISAVTWGELRYGAEKSQKTDAVLRVLDEFVTLVPVLPLSPECGAVYGAVRADLERKGLPIGNNDLWLAAHALAAGLTLVTNNMREFVRIPGLNVENWV